MRFAVALGLIMGALTACRDSDEARAEALCEEAKALEKRDPRAALELKRRLYEEMPTAGTRASRRCLQPVRAKMGAIRVRVSEDETGEAATLEGCTWAADVLEAFAQSVNPPFKRRWAESLMERCVIVVGRAWTRAPDDPALMALHERLKTLAD